MRGGSRERSEPPDTLRRRVERVDVRRGAARGHAAGDHERRPDRGDGRIAHAGRESPREGEVRAVGRAVDLGARMDAVVAADEIHGVADRRGHEIGEGARQASDDRAAVCLQIERLHGRAALSRAAAEDEELCAEDRAGRIVERLRHAAERGETSGRRVEAEDAVRRLQRRRESACEEHRSVRRDRDLAFDGARQLEWCGRDARARRGQQCAKRLDALRVGGLQEIEAVGRVEVAGRRTGNVRVSVLPDDASRSHADDDDTVPVIVVDRDQPGRNLQCQRRMVELARPRSRPVTPEHMSGARHDDRLSGPRVVGEQDPVRCEQLRVGGIRNRCGHAPAQLPVRPEVVDPRAVDLADERAAVGERCRAVDGAELGGRVVPADAGAIALHDPVRW